jgi:hypothetical protein
LNAKGVRIEVRACNDWPSIQSSVNAHVDDSFDVLAADYIAHLDTSGEKDQREGIRNVYRMAQDMSLSYKGGRGLCVLTAMQIIKTEADEADAGECRRKIGVCTKADGPASLSSIPILPEV